MTTQVEKQYKVISSGKLKKGVSAQTVNANLCQRLKINSPQADKILQQGTIIKQGIDKASALKYQTLFEKLGIEVNFKLIEIKNDKNTTDHNKEYFETLLQQPFKKIKTSLGYKFGLITVLILSLLAPLLYLAFIVGIVYGAYAYGVFYSEAILGSANIKAQIIAVLIPYFIMSVVFVFLMRPLFIGYKKPSYYVLNKNQFPGIFHLVEVMCKKIAVPVPKEITVDNEVNAHAGPINGLADLLKGNLRLNVGLPLLAGMKINQFIGVLAHEFGHFAQPTAMFANTIINRVNNWLADRAYNADPLQDKLTQWKKDNEDSFFMGYAIFGIMLLNGCLFSIRLIFKGLFHVNYFLTRFMSRKMEYDADCYESVFAGSKEFSNTSKQLRKLSYGSFKTDQLNSSAWNDNQLLNDYSGAIAFVTDKLSNEIDNQIQEDMQSMKFDAWSTHPADNDRINYINKRNDQGIVKDDFAAINICPMFEKLTKDVTAYMYFKSFGNDKFKQYLKENKDILIADKKKQEQSQSIDTYYNGTFSNRLIDLELSNDVEISSLNLEQCITKIRREALNFQNLDKQVGQSVSKLHSQKMGLVFSQANVDFEFNEFYLTSTTPYIIQEEINNTFKELNSTQKKRSVKDNLFRLRIEHDIQLMDGEQKHFTITSLESLTKVAKFHKDLLELDVNCRILNELHDQDEEIFELIRSNAEELQNKIYDLAMSILNRSESIILVNHEQQNLKAFILTWAESVALARDEMTTRSTYQLSQQIRNSIIHYFYSIYSHIIDQCLSVELDNNIKQIKLI
ncbi:MAG: M48 family metalloprotease [Saccharospirillaceae bacterium]|nr:M48 family metalloprotease [Pseudomonadales bacterium]NRB80766.1 M48 family metalloprotease [Saccharospirillaceae bacterium]